MSGCRYWKHFQSFRYLANDRCHRYVTCQLKQKPSLLYFNSTLGEFYHFVKENRDSFSVMTRKLIYDSTGDTFCDMNILLIKNREGLMCREKGFKSQVSSVYTRHFVSLWMRFLSNRIMKYSVADMSVSPSVRSDSNLETKLKAEKHFFCKIFMAFKNRVWLLIDL